MQGVSTLAAGVDMQSLRIKVAIVPTHCFNAVD
jgi:hypothetical protein